MKIFLNKFVLLIIFVIFMLIWYQIYKIDNSFSYKDTNSYFYLIKWNWYISSNTWKKILKVWGEKENIKAWDFVATIGTDSLWIIEWWDNSITRIGWNSRLEIKESDIKNDLSEIKINFRLENWKSWSNVVNMFWEKSYFKEEFQNVIAWVRWTVFEVNLDNKYVYVKSHQVELENTKTEEKTIISEGWVFSYDFWKALDWKMKDFIWGQLNENIDKEYLIKLKNQTEAYLNEYKWKFNINNYLNSKYKVIDEINSENPSLDKIKEMISSMTESDKNTLYYMLMFNYQKLNIVDSSSDLFTKKMLYRDVLMLVATDENKKNILKYTLYDLNDTLSSSWTNLSNIVSFLNKNNNYINSLWVDKSVLTLSWTTLNVENLKQILGTNFSSLENILWTEKFNSLKWENIWDTINNINNFWKEKVNETLDSIYNFIKK